MSLFDQNLDKGGILGDVVGIYDIRYPSGMPLTTPRICARDTTQSSADSYPGYSFDSLIPNFSEFDTESDYVLTPQGFYSNRGFIEYKHLFTEEVLNDLIEANSDLDLQSLLTNSILRGNIETLFIPYESTHIFQTQKPKNERFIYDYEWWRLVKTSIEDGISKCIDPLWRTHSYVRMSNYTHYYQTFRCSFYITIKIFGHNVYGDIFWPVRDNDRYGQLFGTIDSKYSSMIKHDIGSPISISTIVEMEYIGEL
jgi:hypothetical protein